MNSSLVNTIEEETAHEHALHVDNLNNPIASSKENAVYGEGACSAIHSMLILLKKVLLIRDANVSRRYHSGFKPDVC